MQCPNCRNNILAGSNFCSVCGLALTAGGGGNIFNVHSHNQSGGITAGQVNIGPQKRHLNDQHKSQLKGSLDRSRAVRVDALLGNAEAMEFATAIANWLRNEGYEVDGVNQVVWSGPVGPQQIDPSENTVMIGGI